MRLLNKDTKEFEWFDEAPAHEYYILSHRWRGAETSMQGFMQTRHLPVDQLSAGDAKVHKLCETMRRKDRPLKYVWVDSCCIDKTSSSELQEAINSMYRWYEQAAECIVYLDDVDAVEGSGRLFKNSEWFTRGWCLQELLGPLHQSFFNADWQFLGYRFELASWIEGETGIHRDYFGNKATVRAANVAIRMSWMSKRKTTRGEDMAYALLGIFDINMTMLYGEGAEKAFLRLQKKILHGTNDETIFVWKADRSDYQDGYSGMLAPHPNCFQRLISDGVRPSRYMNRAPYRMTNKGLEIQKYGDLSEKFTDSNTILLNCHYANQRVQIELKKIDENVWVRSDCFNVTTLPESAILYPPTDVDNYTRSTMSYQKVYGTHVNVGPLAGAFNKGAPLPASNPTNHYGVPWERYHVYVYQAQLQRTVKTAVARTA